LFFWHDRPLEEAEVIAMAKAEHSYRETFPDEPIPTFRVEPETETRTVYYDRDGKPHRPPRADRWRANPF
jgi:hypothetical protein